MAFFLFCTRYTSLRRNAMNFVDPKVGSKSEESVNEFKEEYLEDLQKMRDLIDSKLNHP